MMPLPKKVLSALTSVQDIEDALSGKGFQMPKYVLRDYSTLIRRLTIGGSSGGMSDTSIQELTNTKQIVIDPHDIFHYVGTVTLIQE